MLPPELITALTVELPMLIEPEAPRSIALSKDTPMFVPSVASTVMFVPPLILIVSASPSPPNTT